MALCLAAGLACPACERERGSVAQPAEPQAPIRIVSLSPAISRTLVDFDLDEKIVGRTPYCESLNAAIPVVGELLTIDYEALVRLQPTHILVQPPASGIDARLAELARTRGWTIGQWRLDGIDDVETLVRELPATLFADDSPEFATAARRSAELLNDMALALSPGGGGGAGVQPVFTSPVLLVNEIEPVMVFGVGTYLHDVLIALGGRNATSARGWVQLSLEDVTRLNPAAIIIIVERGAAADEPVVEVAGPLGTLEIDAVQNQRIAVLRHPDSLFPSSGIIGVANEMRVLLHALAKESSP